MANNPSGTNAASKAFLIAAVVMGVLATMLAFWFIESAQGAERGPTLNIVVAKHDLRPNVAIDPEKDLVSEAVPTRFASLVAQSVKWDERVNYKGQRLNRKVLTGQPVFLSDFSAMGEIDFADMKARGMTALQVPTEPGIVIPGDYVKVLISRPDVAAAAQAGVDPSRGPYKVARVGPDSGYKVLAVGGSLFKTRSQVTSQDQYEAGSASAKTVTLEVTEIQAGELLAALGGGQTKAVLLLVAPPAGATTSP